jgi:hypothetical protein
MSELALDAAAKPLKHPKYEIFARQRALNQSPLVAGQIAGLNYDRRNLFRIEKKPAVAARIAWLSRQDEEALREKRNRLEELLWVGLYADRADFYETVEIPITDRNGRAVLKRNGEPYTKIVTQPKPLEKLTDQQRCLIESLTYTESGKPNLKLVSKEYCHLELRKMLGGDTSPEQRAHEFSQYTNAELLADLDRLANELGIKTALMIEPSNPPMARP